jgi:hypothetical protein
VPEPADQTSRTLCPICGGPNDCGLAAGKTTCWCFGAEIPAAALARVPDAARDQRCICPACAGQTAGDRPSPAGR